MVSWIPHKKTCLPVFLLCDSVSQWLKSCKEYERIPLDVVWLRVWLR